jgi:hypothetical protein
MERNDIGMIETSLDLDLPFESSHFFVVAANARGQHLHGLDSFGDRVLDLVDGSHSTRADEADYLVVANNVTDLDRHCYESAYSVLAVRDRTEQKAIRGLWKQHCGVGVRPADFGDRTSETSPQDCPDSYTILL